MKRSKKRISMLVATAAVIAVSIGATYAFLTSETDKLENTFTPSDNIQVEIQEPNWTGDKDDNNDGQSGKEKAEKYTPNILIEKDPFLKNTTSSNSHNDEYVAMELDYYIQDSTGKMQEVTYSEFKKIASVYSYNGTELVEGFSHTWKASPKFENGENDRFLYYGATGNLCILPKNDTTIPLFDYVKINPELKLKDQNGNDVTITMKDVNGNSFTVKGMPKFEIDVKGFAVQADNITVDEAVTELVNLMDNN